MIAFAIGGLIGLIIGYVCGKQVGFEQAMRRED